MLTDTVCVLKHRPEAATEQGHLDSCSDQSGLAATLNDLTACCQLALPCLNGVAKRRDVGFKGRVSA